MKLAVIGATSMLGKPVTEQLIKSGFEISIIARDAKKARDMFPDSGIKEADLRDKPSLVNALKGFDGLYISLNTLQTVTKTDWLPEREGLKNIIDAAKETGIRWIAMISSIIKDYQGTDGFNWWVFDVKQNAEDMIMASGIPYLLFYPSCFMECFTGPYKIGNIIPIAGHTDIKKYWITGEDYGKQVARAFETVPENESRKYIIQGPEAYTDEVAADIFISNYHKRLIKIKIPEAMLKIAGIFNRKANYGYHILHAMNYYPEKFEASQTWADLGTPTTTLQQFARSAR